MIQKREWREGLKGVLIEKRTAITDKERVWYWENKGEWVAIQITLKAQNHALHMPKERNNIRFRDRAFLHRHLPKSMFDNKQIDHFWLNDKTAEYGSCRLVDEEENQLKEKHKLEEEGWDIEELVKQLKEKGSEDWHDLRQKAIDIINESPKGKPLYKERKRKWEVFLEKKGYNKNGHKKAVRKRTWDRVKRERRKKKNFPKIPSITDIWREKQIPTRVTRPCSVIMGGKNVKQWMGEV